MFKVSIESKLSLNKNRLELSYPCSSHSSCYPYNISLPKGHYLFECYGASGGSSKGTFTTQRETTGTSCISQDIVTKHKGNTKCDPLNSPGSGGYISTKIFINKETRFYVNIGGSGVFGDYPSTKGGYNGGGDCKYSGCASGGGATDIRVLENKLTNRILVAGGGGGTDDGYLGASGNTDDGSGGSGGYPEGQGYWAAGKYQNVIATQSKGYSFGIGQSADNSVPSNYDIAGAGGGWFGGYASMAPNAGAGGGSSFALLSNSTIPSNVNYAFTTSSIYVMKLNSYANGIWGGDGKAIITKLDPFAFSCNRKQTYKLSLLFITILIC